MSQRLFMEPSMPIKILYFLSKACFMTEHAELLTTYICDSFIFFNCVFCFSLWHIIFFQMLCILNIFISFSSYIIDIMLSLIVFVGD